MLEDIISKILGDKSESLSKETKMLYNQLESLSEENEKLRNRLEFSRKEVDSYKKLNVEHREKYGNLRKLYDEAKIEKNRSYQQFLEISKENSELKKMKEHYAELEKWKKNPKSLQTLHRQIDSLQLELDNLRQMSKETKKHISDLEDENKNLHKVNRTFNNQLNFYRSLHEGGNEGFNAIVNSVKELEEAFRTTFNFTEPSLEEMVKLFKSEKDRIENLHKEIELNNVILKMRLENMTKAHEKLEREECKLERNKKILEELYPQYVYLLKNQRSVLGQVSYLKKCEAELNSKAGEKIKDAYEKLKDQEFEYEQRKSRLQKNMALLKREEKWFHSELVGMNRQKDKMINENIEIQRKLYAEIEKNEQTLFIIRSLNRMNPLYEKITEELVASVRGEKTRRIVLSFLKGESIYEIAQKEGKSATSVQRIFLLAVNALRKTRG